MLARIHERLKGHIAFNVTVIVLFPLILAIGVLVPTFMAETTCGRVFALFRQAEGLALQGEAELQARATLLLRLRDKRGCCSRARTIESSTAVTKPRLTVARYNRLKFEYSDIVTLGSKPPWMRR